MPEENSSQVSHAAPQETQAETANTFTEVVQQPVNPQTQEGSSISGVNGEVPAEIKGWNWGAFFLTWIWAISHSVWIGLLALIGPIQIVMAIILGIKGNEWAWQNRKFESVEQFKAIQKKWAIWGLVFFILVFLTFFVAVFISMSTVTRTGENSNVIPATDNLNTPPSILSPGTNLN